MSVVAIDPGLHATGVGLFNCEGVLQTAFLVQIPKNVTGFKAAMAMKTALLASYVSGHDELVIEFPQTYGGRAKRGDANDLLLLAALVGAIGAGRYKKVTTCLPSEWKGQTPKDVSMRRTLSKLSEEEKKRIVLPTPSLRHNVYDAIGIGLKHLGR